MKTNINKLDFLKKTVIVQDLLSFMIKLIEKIPDPSNIKEFHKSYLRKKN